MIRKESEDVLNMLLVKLFNDILKIEAASINQGEFVDLSVTENHILEAIGKNREMTMTEVANNLNITVGTLTTAINRLIKKDYVERRRIEEDRRVVLIKLTEKGEKAFDSHAQFHDEMIKSVMLELSEKEEEVLIRSLKKVTNFFEEKYNANK